VLQPPVVLLVVVQNTRLIGLCSDALLSRCCDDVLLQEPEWPSLLFPLLLSLPQSPLMLTSSACDSCLRRYWSSMLYLGCFTGSAKIIGEFIDIFKHKYIHWKCLTPLQGLCTQPLVIPESAQNGTFISLMYLQMGIDPK